MLHDARSLADGTTLEGELCIVGGGPAGIAIARELSATASRVILLESGGLDLDAATQALYAGTAIGVPEDYLQVSRLRLFGGTSNHWHGWCTPLDPLDFEAREWVPDSGWPISRRDLDPYYRRAQALCELGPYDYDSEHWTGAGGGAPGEGPALVTRVWQFSPPTRFGERYRAELEASPRVQILLHANAVGLEAAEDGSSVERVAVRTLSGRRFAVRARNFVVAAGAIETPRLLLASADVRPAGLGNDRDLVGRFFAEHPHVFTAGRLTFSDPAGYERMQRRVWDRRPFRLGLGVHPELQRREGLLNGSFAVRPPQRMRPGPGSAALRLLGAVGERGTGARALWSLLDARFEQAPNAENRIALGDERDALGVRRPVLRWRAGEIDRRSLRRSFAVLAAALGAAGAGRVRLADWVLDPQAALPERALQFGPHPSGTTRMSDSPARGVVDPSCRVHGVANLYVAGSSVFPTAGCAHPTLTVLALALRLADHLRADQMSRVRR